MQTYFNQKKEAWLTKVEIFGQIKVFWNFWKKINLTAPHVVNIMENQYTQ